jgi:hypothetical protein
MAPRHSPTELGEAFQSTTVQLYSVGSGGQKFAAMGWAVVGQGARWSRHVCISSMDMGEIVKFISGKL